MTDSDRELEELLGRPLTDEERALEALREICWKTRFGVVQGVEIDLRHPELGKQWSPTWLFGSAGTGPSSEDGPWLVFPWTEAHDRKGRRGAGRPCVIKAGDRVRIEFVERIHLGTEIDHPADRERRDAFIVVERSSGGRSCPKRPVIFWPRLSLMRPGRAGRPTFARVADRICATLGIDSLGSYQLLDLDRLTLAEAAFGEARNAQRWHADLIDYLDNPSSERILDREFYLREIVDAAVALGYYAAQGSAERFMAPSALARRKIAAAARRGGQRGAETRRRKGDLWRDRARPIILEIMAEPGAHTRDNVANEVEARWKWPQRCPSVSSLKSLLAEMETWEEVSF